jgi:hypothetical protein
MRLLGAFRLVRVFFDGASNFVRILDIRVQSGGAEAARQALFDYGASNNIIVRINEF